MKFISLCFFDFIVLLGSGSLSSLLRVSELLQSCRLQSYFGALVKMKSWCPVILHSVSYTEKKEEEVANRKKKIVGSRNKKVKSEIVKKSEVGNRKKKVKSEIRKKK